MLGTVTDAIADALRCIRNDDVRKDGEIPTVNEEIGKFSFRYEERTANRPDKLTAKVYPDGVSGRSK